MTLIIPANDHGNIRVFQTLQPLQTDASDALLQDLFGVDLLDPRFVDIISLFDLSVMQLSEYIIQGYDIQPEIHDVQTLNQTDGYVVLVLSAASRGRRIKLEPAAHLRHVTTILPNVQLTPIAPLPNKSAAGDITDPSVKPVKSDAQIGGMVATLVLIVLFFLVGIMIWVA